MPYSKERYGTREQFGKYNRCVKAVSAQGGRYNPWAVCRASIYGHKLNASLASYNIHIEDVYYALDKESLNYSNFKRLVTDKDLIKPKGDYYWKILIPLKAEKSFIFNTYTSDKDKAKQYIKAIRMIQHRSIARPYRQDLYTTKQLFASEGSGWHNQPMRHRLAAWKGQRMRGVFVSK